MNTKINAISRDKLGKGASRYLRRNNKIPAVVYGGEHKAQNLTIDFFEINHLLEFDNDIYSSVLELNIGKNNTEKVILKAMQRHPLKNVVTHMDFQRISKKSIIKTSVPILLTGENDNENIRLGAVINKFIDMVEIQCLPQDLPRAIELDIATLSIGQSVRLSDLIISKNIIITALNHKDDSHNQTVVSLSSPKIKTDDSADGESDTEQPTEEEPKTG